MDIKNVLRILDYPFVIIKYIFHNFKKLINPYITIKSITWFIIVYYKIYFIFIVVFFYYEGFTLLFLRFFDILQYFLYNIGVCFSLFRYFINNTTLVSNVCE